MTGGSDFLFTGAATLGWAFGASRRGAQHEKNGTPCQDAFATWSGTIAARPCIAVAVADGHGDPRYDRSGTGAGLAVRAGLDELIAFFQAYAHADSSARIRSGFRADFPRRVTRRWRSYVAEDQAARGEPAEEDAGTGDFAPCIRYGTTLIAALVTEDEILLGQIGDGAVRIVRPSGEIIAPFRPDPAIVGKATHSLSARDAHLLWQTGAWDRAEGAALVLATDGLPDSFGDGDPDETEGNEYSRFVGSLLDRIRNFGVGEIAGQVPAWLDRYSQTGSGDDMTLALVRINPAPDPVPSPASDPVPAAPEVPAPETPPAEEEPDPGMGSIWDGEDA